MFPILHTLAMLKYHKIDDEDFVTYAGIVNRECEKNLFSV